MLSRVADSLYWMSRYLERAEHTSRVISVQLNLMLERGAGSDDEYWVRVLRSLGVQMTAEEETRHRAPRLYCLFRDRGARKRPPGPRADQLGDVGAVEPAVSFRAPGA